MLGSVYDLVHLRWRAAQLLLAISDGDDAQVSALRQAMRVEGITSADRRDETGLLLRQFGHRTSYWLRAEVDRLYRQLRQWCGRCRQRAWCLDKRGLCPSCIVAERQERRRD
jgi:hypothetical protein